jgi:hypothetical protein
VSRPTLHLSARQVSVDKLVALLTLTLGPITPTQLSMNSLQTKTALNELSMNSLQTKTALNELSMNSL